MKLTIEGKDYELKWGFGAHYIACEREGITLSQLDAMIFSNDPYALLNLAYSALENAARIKGEVLPFNLFAFIEWVDNEPQGTGILMMEDYKKSKFLGFNVGVDLLGEQEENKKKVTKSRSKKSTAS